MKGGSRAARWLAAAALASLFGLSACDSTYSFDAIEVGGDQAGRAPSPATNAQFIRGVYADLLGRTPEIYDFQVSFQGQSFVFPIDEQRTLVDALDSVGDPDALRALLVAGFVRSAEVEVPEKDAVGDPAEFIREQFRRYLGREPGSYELVAFEREWAADPAVGPRTVIRALIGSREYQSR
jgi:hypothetical protein